MAETKEEIDKKYFSVVPLSLRGGKILAGVDFLDMSSDVTPMYDSLMSRDKQIRHHWGTQ